MSTPLSYDERKKIIRLRKQGQTYLSISKSIPCSERTVKRIWNRYQQKGEEGLKTNFHLSGRKSPYGKELEDELKLIRDGDQGAPYVRSVLMEKHPDWAIPHERSIQRWWKVKGTNRPRGRPKHKSDWSKEPNHTWQIDGKDHLELKTGQMVSWINIADEGTSSDLHTQLFPL